MFSLIAEFRRKLLVTNRAGLRGLHGHGHSRGTSLDDVVIEVPHGHDMVRWAGPSLPPTSVTEVPLTREEHRDTGLVSRFDDLTVFLATAGLRHRSNAMGDGCFKPVGKGEECV